MGSGERAVVRLPVRKPDVTGLTPDRYDRAEIARMLDAADPGPLVEASLAWDAAAGLLATLHDDLRARAEVLAAGWDGAAAGACQHALRRLAATARQLSRYAGDLRAALSAAADAQRQAKRQLTAFRAHPTLLGGIEVGGTGDRLLAEIADPDLAAHLDQTARQWLRAVYDGYRAALATLPDRVAFDLPGLAAPEPPGPAGAAPQPAPGSPPATGTPAGPLAPPPAAPVPERTGQRWTGQPGPADQPDRGGIEPAVPGPAPALTPVEVLGTAAAAAGGTLPAPTLPDASPAAGSAGLSYGGAVKPAGAMLAGGAAVGYLPLDPDQPGGKSWQGPAAPPEPGGGPPWEQQPAATGSGDRPPGPLADLGPVVGAVAEAVAGGGQQPTGPDQAAAPGRPEAAVPPAVDAPYVAAAVADAIAAAQQRAGPAGDQGTPEPAPAPAPDPLPDARPAADANRIPDAAPDRPR